jgi:hypothetical protein
VSQVATVGNTATLVSSIMGANDYFRILTGGSEDGGYAEISTADNASEPIYVRQYAGVFTSLERTATLLDGSGNTSFPGTVTSSSLTSNSFNASDTSTVTSNCFLTKSEISSNYIGKEVPICIGSQLLWGDVVDTTISSSSGIFAGAYGFAYFQPFADWTVPSGYSLKFKITALIWTEADNATAFTLNNISTEYTNSWSSTDFKRMVSSSFFSLNDIVLEPTYHYESAGCNLKISVLSNPNSLHSRVYLPTIHAYLIKN